MKKIIIFTILMASLFASGKELNKKVLDTLWYDNGYKITTKENAKIYKLYAYKINNKYLHVYFYKSNDKNQLISYSLDANDSNYDGKRTYYYENGAVKHVINYKNNKKNGPYLEYYDNAIVNVQGVYSDDKRKGVFVINDRNGNLKVKEFWQNGNKISTPIDTKQLALGE